MDSLNPRTPINASRRRLSGFNPFGKSKSGHEDPPQESKSIRQRWTKADKRDRDKRVLTHEAERMSTEIPIWVNGEIRWLSGVDKKTTCKDIVEVLLDGEGIDKAEVKDFTIMERWRKVERPLDENSKILKIWSHWGDEKKEVRLCLRRIDNEVDSGRGSPIGSGSTPSLRKKRNRCRGIGKPGLGHPEGLHPRRLAELSTFHKRDCNEYHVQNGKQAQANQETPTKNCLLDHQTHGTYDEIYNDNENVNCRRKSSAKSYLCPSTGKLHSTPLADYTNSKSHRRAGKCCSKRDSKHKVRNSESIEKLMKLILAQGATIQSQLQKLKERDEQIETIEHERHRERIEKNGRNYLLETYLGSLKEAEIPVEMDEERAEDSGVNTEGGSDQMNAIKRKNMERLKQNETEPDSDPGPSGIRNNLEEKGNGHRQPHHHHHNHTPQTMKNERSRSESRTNESKSIGVKVHLKRTLSDNSIAKGSESRNGPEKSPSSNDNLAKTKEDSDDVVELNKIQSQIHMWEKVFKINKKLEKEEENLVRLHIKIKKIQNENYRFAKDNAERIEEEENTKSKKNDEDQAIGAITETDQEQAKSTTDKDPNEIENETDYLKVKQNLETLKTDLDLNSKEIYMNFTRLLEEDEMVEHKRNCLKQLLTDLERTQREEEMLNEMIVIRQSQKPETEAIVSENYNFPSTSTEETPHPTPKPLENFPTSSEDRSFLTPQQVQVTDESQVGVDQRPEELDASKTAQTLRPKNVKISFQDSIKSCDGSLENAQEKSVREPGTTPTGALKGILKNRNKATTSQDVNIYSSNNKPNESQNCSYSFYSNSHGNNNNNYNYPNYNSPNFTRVPLNGDVPLRNDFSYSTATYATPYNTYNHQNVQNMYEPHYIPSAISGDYDVKTVYSLKGSYTHDMTRTSNSHFPHNAMTKTKVLNDNDSSTSSDTSGLCSMYSSSPSVEQPYIEHGYILDTLV